MPPLSSTVPTLRLERQLLRSGHAVVAGMDEVGRGALAGPVSVGVVVVDLGMRSAPAGLRDSKLLAPAAREALAPRLRRWALAHAVGHAEPEEIDRYGILVGLRLAGVRALRGLGVPVPCVVLDGNYDWLTRPAVLFDLDAPPKDLAAECGSEEASREVHLVIKGDLRCAAVAAASVLAKTARDAIMVERSALAPEYAWHENKGYSAPEHLAALAARGPHAQHRQSWRLPGLLVGDDGELAGLLPGRSRLREASLRP